MVKSTREPGAEMDHLAHEAIGAAIEVHRVLGPGLPETAYESALDVEWTLRGVPFARQATINLSYKGHPAGKGRIDLQVGGSLIVELKAVEAINDVHTAQVISYLKMTGHSRGLLVNFNVPVPRDGIQRIVVS
ncbi:MAG: GxxExxY protein [Planctomycetota bacterium]